MLLPSERRLLSTEGGTSAELSPHHHSVVLSRSNSSSSTSLAASSPSLGICAECSGRITNVTTACQALGCFYHDKCFICCCCQRTLRGKTFYKDQDKIYCEEDYLYCGFQRMAEKCTVCGHIIAQTILQAMGKSYHPGCFRCTVCNKCLGEDAFTVDAEGRIFCLYDFYLATAPTCAACANPILPDSPADEVLRVVAMNKEFHIECYRCEDCNLHLSDEVSSRCYPYTETSDSGLLGRTHLLCLKCHLARIGATPAPGQNLDVLLQQRGVGVGSQRRGSNGSSSLTSSTLSCDMGPGSSGTPSTPTFGSKSILTPSAGGRSSPFSTESRRGISKPWLQGRQAGYYGEGDGR
ncbi:unnamed protein product [Hymenolepis diminuta]|nr:unnamed protein product [Hymenolepis diminuta]